MPIIIDPSLPEPTPPVTVTGPDGVLTVQVDQPWAGALLLADFTTATPQPDKVAFYRVGAGGDTVPVRSGDLAWAPGGYGIAYDHEAPLGAGVAWYAVPVVDGVPGVACDTVAAEIPEPAGGAANPGVWLKCLEDPALSRQVLEQSWTEVGYDQDITITRPLGSLKPKAALLTPGTAGTSTLTVLARDLAGEEAVTAIANSGMFLAQSKAAYSRRDRYWVATSVKVTRTSDKVRVGWRTIALELTEVARPGTAGQALRVPGRSYADRLAQFPTYDTLPARSYLQALTG